MTNTVAVELEVGPNQDPIKVALGKLEWGPHETLMVRHPANMAEVARQIIFDTFNQLPIPEKGVVLLLPDNFDIDAVANSEVAQWLRDYMDGLESQQAAEARDG